MEIGKIIHVLTQVSKNNARKIKFSFLAAALSFFYYLGLAQHGERN